MKKLPSVLIVVAVALAFVGRVLAQAPTGTSSPVAPSPAPTAGAAAEKPAPKAASKKGRTKRIHKRSKKARAPEMSPKPTK